MTSRSSSKFDEWFSVDLRSLAVFRIALASVLLYDLVDRARSFRAHYTDAGILPAELLEQVSGGGIRFSLHYHLSSSEGAVFALFVLSWLAATALLVGHRTKVATFICWLLLASLQVRNPYLASMGGDSLLRVLLTWSLLLPLGARFSLDAKRDPRWQEHANRLRSFPALGLLIQVCLVYWVTGIKKDGETWLDGSAVYYALHMDYWATPLGVALREQTWLLPLLTHATRWFELLGPFLAFSPLLTAPLRLLTIFLFAGFHFSLAVCLDIGMFPLVSMVGWCAFLPGVCWDRLFPGTADESFEEEEEDDDCDDEEDDDCDDEEDEEEFDDDEDVEEYDDEAVGVPPRLTPWFGQIAGLLLLVYVLASLGNQIGWLRVPIPGPVTAAAKALRIQQYWQMFSPNPPPLDFWPVLSGTQQDGREMNLLLETPVSFSKPDDIAATLPDFRWRLYFSSLMTIEKEDGRFVPTYIGLTRYLCRSWNASHAGQERVDKVRASIVVEFTRESFEDEPVSATLYEADCPETS